MTCTEFERVLPELEGGYSFEQEEHLKSCRRCSTLTLDLEAIAQQARLLQGTEEPSPVVWNSIEIALKEEGLIRPSSPGRFTVPALSRWRMGWLAPVAAALLVAFGVLLHQQQSKLARQEAARSSAAITNSAHDPRGSSSTDEDQLLGIVSSRGPAFRAAYESDLRAVDAYIRDAELSARNDPNDEIAQQYLMNAYEQRAMVYQMAMERSLQ
jgi:hypothetical protein